MISAMNSQDFWDLGLNVFSGLGFWVLGLGCRVAGSKFGVYGVGFCVLRVGCRVCSSCWVLLSQRVHIHYLWN